MIVVMPWKPVMCGSTTFETSPAATPASTALPPASRIMKPAWVER